MSDFTHIAFTDLETTGLFPEYDEIIEVGIVLTDNNLNVLGEDSWIVQPTRLDVLSLHPAVLEMHTKNGLIDEIIARGQRDRAMASDGTIDFPELWDIDTVDRQIHDWIDGHNYYDHPTFKVALGGSGVSHFDIRWIQAKMPFFAGMLYRSTVDVGVLRRFIEMVAQRPELVPAANRNLTHRALDDARDHLEEARVYRLLLRQTVKP